VTARAGRVPPSVAAFAEAVARIGRAASFDDLVGEPASRHGGTDVKGAAEAAYRMWAKVVHPDFAPPGRKAAATAAFARLSGLYAERGGVVLRTARGSYRVRERAHSGDIADLSVVNGGDALVKIPREPRDNDLMEAEADALTRLWRDGDPKYRPYAPRLIETFRHEDGTRKRRTVNVVGRLDGFVPLTRLTGAVDPRDAAWMWRRLLVGLGWAHRAGVVHGAVVEEHVLIHPGEHGLALVDWCYSGTRPKAIVKNRGDAYPPEVRAREEIGPATDVFMATGLMARLMRDRMPQAMRRFAGGCMFDRPRMRPQDAWVLLGELDELLHKLYGPRRFRPMTI
jgi:hypothetical protein